MTGLRLLCSLPLLLLLTAVAGAQPVWVTGKPANAEFLKSVLQNRGWTEFPTNPLNPGQSWTNSQGQTVQNLEWQPPAPSLAALSDHPEKVHEPGGLFAGGLTAGRTLNFQYYHLGRLEGDSPGIDLVVSNTGSSPAQLYLRQGVGKPSKDYFSTGHTNNVQWLRAQSSGLGQVFTIPAGETVTVFRQNLPYDQVVSGLLGLTEMEGPPLQFAFAAHAFEGQALALDNMLSKEDVHSRGFYPAAVQKIERTYRVGQEPLQVAVGNVRQQTFSGVRELRGDYGVTYELTFHLVNPTAKPAKVQFVFNPRGGNATGTFLFADQLIEVPNTPAFQEKLLRTMEIPARGNIRVKMTTIPEGASSYPVRIVVKGS